MPIIPQNVASNATTNLSSLASIAGAATALAGLVLVTPSSTVGYQPLNPPDANGEPSKAQLPPTLVFNYEGEQNLMLESDITDHYVEDNTSRQDQIALKPEIFTTHGFIGELNDVVPGVLAPIKKLADTLVPIGSYTPQLSTSALIAYNNALFAYQVSRNLAQSAVGAWSSIAGAGNEEIAAGSGVFTSGSSQTQNLQQRMFQQFYGYWASRTLFNIQTPWAVFTNMAIKSLRAIQDAETRVITDFEVSFKKIRVAKTIRTTGRIGSSLQGRAGAQAAALTNNGTNSGIPGYSLATSVSKMFA